MIHIEECDPFSALRTEPSPLEPLWLALFDHHVSIGAAGMLTKPRAGSWPQRRDHYLDTIGRASCASLWLAATDAGPVGYALSFVDTLDGAPVEVLESLSLLPETRGNGLGGRLVAAVEERARERGIRTIAIDVMGGNDRALRFYERAGYSPYSVTWMRSAPPRGQITEPGDVSAIISALAAIGVHAETTGKPDDTWATAESVAVLSLPATVSGAAPGETQRRAAREAWLAAFDACVRDLEAAGHWTVWLECEAGQEWLADAMGARRFRHGMSRVTKAL